MVSHIVRPTKDDKCSDLKQAVKCFEAVVCAAKTRLSNEEIESYLQQAFNLESSTKRLGDPAKYDYATNRAMFCMTTFCASMCQTFEATINIRVNITLQVCGHKPPGCGAKRASYGDFISTMRNGEVVIPGLQLLTVGRSVSHLGSVTNRLLRFYRQKAGLQKQPNPVETLLRRRTLIEPVVNPDAAGPDLEKTLVVEDAVQKCKAAIKREASVDEDDDDGHLYSDNKRVKRSATAALETKIDPKALKASDLRKQLNEFINAETGWLAKAQRMQSQLEEQEKIYSARLIKVGADEKDVKINSATIKVLETHVKQLQEDLSQEKQRTGRLTNSLTRVEKHNKRLKHEVCWRTQELRRLSEMNDESRARYGEHLSELEDKLRRCEERTGVRGSRRAKRYRH